MPSTAFFQVLVDMKNSANVVPGKFAAKGHDYRADLLPFFNAALGFDATEAQLDAIATWLELEELQRSTWISEHGADRQQPRGDRGGTCAQRPAGAGPRSRRPPGADRADHRRGVRCRRRCEHPDAGAPAARRRVASTSSTLGRR